MIRLIQTCALDRGNAFITEGAGGSAITYHLALSRRTLADEHDDSFEEAMKEQSARCMPSVGYRTITSDPPKHAENPHNRDAQYHPRGVDDGRFFRVHWLLCTRSHVFKWAKNLISA